MLYASANFGESFLLEVVALVLVIAFIVRKVVPPLRKAMDHRAETIRGQLAAGDEARAAAAALVESRRAALEAAKSEAAAIVDQARQSAAQIVADGSRRAESEAERLAQRAGTEVLLAHSRVRQEVATEVGALVLELTERVVVAELDEVKHHRLIAEAISAAESEAVL